MPTSGFTGFAATARTTGNAGANSIFLTPLVAQQNGTVTAVLLDSFNANSSISLKALVYDGSHSALLASGSTVTALTSGYNRLPLAANLSVTAGTTYYVGYVCSAICNVGVQTTGGPGAWFVSGGQSVASPANPLVGGVGNATSVICGLELDGSGTPDFGWGPDFAPGVTRSLSNTVATFNTTTNIGARSIITRATGSGKYYAEFDIGGTINNGVAVGIASANWGVKQGVVAAATATGYLGFLYPNGIRSGNASITALTYVSGDTIGIAYDAVNSLIWWNKNNGTWWAQTGSSGDPVAGTNGFGFNPSGWPAALGAMSGGTGVAAAFTLRDTAGALRYAPPSGYSAWSSGTFPVVVAGSQARVMVLA
jgi:hypothetical protein